MPISFLFFRKRKGNEILHSSNAAKERKRKTVGRRAPARQIVTHIYVRTNVTVSPERTRWKFAQKHERILGTIASAKAGRRFRSFRKKSFGIAEKKASKVIPGDVCTRHTVSRISTKMLAHASHFRDVRCSGRRFLRLWVRWCKHRIKKEARTFFRRKT